MRAGETDLRSRAPHRGHADLSPAARRATCRALGLDAIGVGDTVGKRYAEVWAAGVRREKLAALKTVWDVTSHRDPVLGPPEPGVKDALAAP